MITTQQRTPQKNDSIEDYLDILIKKLAIETTYEPIKSSCDEMRTVIPISYKDIPAMQKPKAIFITGAPGSGKSYLMTQFLPPDFKYALYNADLYQEHLLKINGLYGNKERETAIRTELQTENPKATKQELEKLTQSRIASIIATSMAISQKCIRQDFDDMISNKLPIVIDRPGDRTSTVLDDKKRLEKAGYDVMMIMVYVSPVTALQRNQQRERQVHPPRILESWIGGLKNIATYKKTFGDNFFLIKNDSTPFEINPKELESYLPYASKSQKTTKDIEKLMNKVASSTFSSVSDITFKIQTFLFQNGGKRKTDASSLSTSIKRSKK